MNPVNKHVIAIRELAEKQSHPRRHCEEPQATKQSHFPAVIANESEAISHPFVIARNAEQSI